MSTQRRTPTLTPDEALQLHGEAFVIDSQQPGATSDLLFNDNMRAAMGEYVKEGLSRGQIVRRLQAMAVRELQSSEAARSEYMAFWEAAGVDVASATYARPWPPDTAFERSVDAMTEARAIIDAMGDDLRLVLTADEAERASRTASGASSWTSRTDRRSGRTWSASTPSIIWGCEWSS